MALSGATFDWGGRVLKQTRQSVPASPHSAAGVTSQAASPEAERGGSGQMLLRDTTTHLVPFSLSSSWEVHSTSGNIIALDGIEAEDEKSR